jgi:hypothetical protein
MPVAARDLADPPIGEVQQVVLPDQHRTDQ